MLLIFKVVVATANTPGPLLGDGVKTTVTMLSPTAVGNVMAISNSLGSSSSVINQTTRQSFRVARVQFYGITGNTGDTFVGPAGQANALMAAIAKKTWCSAVIGNGRTEEVDLGQLDVDAANNNDGILVFAEIL